MSFSTAIIAEEHSNQNQLWLLKHRRMPCFGVHRRCWLSWPPMTLLVLLYLLYLLERRVVWRRVHFSTGTGCLQNSPTRYISEGSRRDKHESNTDRVLHVEQKTDCIITLAVVCYLSHYHTIRADPSEETQGRRHLRKSF